MTKREGKNSMSREEAGKLYDQLKKNMEAKYGKAGLASMIQKEKSRAVKQQSSAKPHPDDLRAETILRSAPMRVPRGSGSRAAVMLVAIFALMKMGMAVMEASGIGSASLASASMVSGKSAGLAAGFSREEAKVLTALDERRAKLEERSRGLDAREADMERRDREFAARLTQVRDLTGKLKSDREQNQRKKSAQLDQLANVYGSMNPEEAAQLIEQLDVTIALALLERMPEKRIGQILALMTPERALSITKMLSSKGG